MFWVLARTKHSGSDKYYNNWNFNAGLATLNCHIRWNDGGARELLADSGLNNEDGGFFVQFGQLALPLGNGFGDYVGVGQGEVAGDAQAGGGGAGLKDVLGQVVVAEGGFDEELGLLFVARTVFELAQGFEALVLLDGNVAYKGKALSVHARGHHGQEDGGGTDHGNDFDAGLVGQFDDFGTGIGHAGTARFGDDAYVVPGFEGFEVLGPLGRGGAFVQGVKYRAIDVHLAVEHAQVAPGGAQVLNNEMAQVDGDLCDCCGDGVLGIWVAQGVGY